MPLHTAIKEVIEFDGELRIIREDGYLYPEGISNLYALNQNDEIRWFAELPIENDTYCNSMVVINGQIRSSTWNGFTVWLDPMNGKIISKRFTK